MCRDRIALLILVVSASLTGCERGGTTITIVDKRVIVSGSPDGVERFAALQGARRPAPVTSPIKPIGNGRAEATVTLPASYNGEDLNQLTREALAAGLNYKFEEHRTAATRRS